MRMRFEDKHVIMTVKCSARNTLRVTEPDRAIEGRRELGGGSRGVGHSRLILGLGLHGNVF